MNDVKIHFNDVIKFKLTDRGKDIYYHRFDFANLRIRRLGGKPIKPEIPEVDSEGYTKMLLWEFIELFGPFTHLAAENYISPIEIIKVGEASVDVEQ